MTGFKGQRPAVERGGNVVRATGLEPAISTLREWRLGLFAYRGTIQLVGAERFELP